MRIKTSTTLPLEAPEKGTVVVVTRRFPPETGDDMPLEQQQQYPYTLITFTDEEFEQWISRLPEDVARIYRNHDMDAIRSSEAIAKAFFNPRKVDALPSDTATMTSKRKRDSSDGGDNEDDDSHGRRLATGTAATSRQKRANTQRTDREREAAKWDKHDMPRDVSGHPPPVSRSTISGRSIEKVIKGWGEERRDYLDGARPVAIEELPAEHRASLAGRNCMAVMTFGVPYIYSYPAQYGDFEAFVQNRESQPYWEPADVWFEGALQNGRLCNCFCTHSTQGDQFGGFTDAADRHLLRTEIRKPRSNADWIVCASCGKSSHRPCLYYSHRHRATRDPEQPNWICDRKCTSNLTKPTQDDATSSTQEAPILSGTILGFAARTVGRPIRMTRTPRGTQKSNTDQRMQASSTSSSSSTPVFDPLLSFSDPEANNTRMSSFSTAAVPHPPHAYSIQQH